MAKKVKVALAWRQHHDAVMAAAECIPTTWLHHHLTGPNNIGELPYTGPQVEELLRRIRNDILALDSRRKEQTCKTS